jgi:hypothetical protein
MWVEKGLYHLQIGMRQMREGRGNGTKQKTILTDMRHFECMTKKLLSMSHCVVSCCALRGRKEREGGKSAQKKVFCIFVQPMRFFSFFVVARTGPPNTPDNRNITEMRAKKKKAIKRWEVCRDEKGSKMALGEATLAISY